MMKGEEGVQQTIQVLLVGGQRAGTYRTVGAGKSERENAKAARKKAIHIIAWGHQCRVRPWVVRCMGWVRVWEVGCVRGRWESGPHAGSWLNACCGLLGDCRALIKLPRRSGASPARRSAGQRRTHASQCARLTERLMPRTCACRAWVRWG